MRREPSRVYLRVIWSMTDSRIRSFCSIRQALISYPTYGLVLTGHSLGGGVAA